MSRKQTREVVTFVLFCFKGGVLLCLMMSNKKFQSLPFLLVCSVCHVTALKQADCGPKPKTQEARHNKLGQTVTI